MATEVSASSAIIWSKTSNDAVMNVRLDSGSTSITKHVNVSAENDFTGTIVFSSLLPNSRYDYEVWFTPYHTANADASTRLKLVSSRSVVGHFKTAPSSNQAAPLTIAWTGDFAGQNVCRDKEQGFPIFATIAQENPDVFIGLGDMIYADQVCKKVGALWQQTDCWSVWASDNT